MSKKSYLSLKDILDNPPRDLEVKGIGLISVRDPTTQDRLDAREDAKKDIRWKEMSEAERNALILDFLAIRMIEKPKITLEKYYQANDVKLRNIIDAAIIDYTLRFKRLQQHRAKEIKDFLEQTRESSLGSSFIS